MKVTITIILIVISNVNSEVIYENSTNLCDRCSCNVLNNAQTLSLNCINQNFKNIISNWPPHNKTIIATFLKNNITTLETIPPTDAIVEIILSQNQIKFLYPDLFANAKNTKFVDLSYNLLTADQITSENFMGPYHENTMEAIGLEILNLAYNQIHSLNKNVFKYLPHLKILNLEGNDFKVLDIQTQLALSSIRNLVSLNLANNELTELVASAIEKCTNLTQLDLSKNRIDFVPPSLQYVGKTLEILKIDENPIIELTSSTFQNLTNLRDLSANNLEKLRYINKSTFANLHKLQKLSLCNNLLLKEINSEAFPNNGTNLETLYLNNNALISLNYSLLSWSKLRIFEIYENPIICSCDLFNITQRLRKDITENENSAYCLDPRYSRSQQIYYLKSDICTAKIFTRKSKQNLFYHHFSIPLAGLVSVIVFAIFVATGLGFTRYRRFLRNRNYPFASQVLYNPISHVGSRI